jgi:insulysin
MKLRLLLLSALWLLPALRAEVPADVPPRPQAPNDTTEYRRFTLDNGLRVLLVSDPKFNKSAAALAVGVGSLSDPREHQGLAHFLEHMLFLGTEKYPGPAAYRSFLESNGGYNNAYTATDRTNFHFEVRHEALPGALDRFAQFFISPQFLAVYAEREMNAVNSEYQLRVENDNWRENQLMLSHFAADHPANHFGIGDRQTLTGTSHDELLHFYETHYSSERMTLAVMGKAPLDQLEKWVRADFSAVPNRHLAPIAFSPDFLAPAPALRLIRMEPVKDLRQLTLLFPLPGTRQDYAGKSAELLGFILGYEGEGSLLSQLKAEGLATGVSAGAESDAPEFGEFYLTIKLTPSGLQHYARVYELVFAAITQLRAAPYPSYLFHERQAMARLDETYQDQGEGIDRATTLANLMQDYPLELAERVPFLWLKEDPVSFSRLLGRLRPDNLLSSLVAKGLPTDQVEPYYGTHFSYVVEKGAPYDALLTPPQVAALQLPKPNPFIPAHADVLPLQPVHLIDEPALSLYYAQDTEFLRPMVGEIYRFRLPRDMASLKNSVLLDFYSLCVNEALNEITYPAGEAGLQFSFAADLEGVQLGLGGYNESMTRLRDVIAANLTGFSLSPERFAALKDRIIRGLASFPRSDAYMVLQQSRRAAVREFYYRPEEKLPVAQTVTLADVQDFARHLYARGKLEALVYGNATGAEAVAATQKISSTLHVSPVAETDLLRRRLLTVAPGESILGSEKLAGNNSAYRHEYVLGTDTPELRAATLVLSNFIGEPYFTEMRTHQQLGYVVFGGADLEEHRSFAYFIIQSGEHPADDLQARSAEFIPKLPALLAALPDEAWANLVGGVRAKLLEQDKTIADRAGRLFDLAYEHEADWLRRDETLAALDQLTKQRTGEILARALAPATRETVTFLGFARQHEPKTPPVPTFTDRFAWKQTRKFE